MGKTVPGGRYRGADGKLYDAAGKPLEEQTANSGTPVASEPKPAKPAKS